MRTADVEIRVVASSADSVLSALLAHDAYGQMLPHHVDADSVRIVGASKRGMRWLRRSIAPQGTTAETVRRHGVRIVGGLEGLRAAVDEMQSAGLSLRGVLDTPLAAFDPTTHAPDCDVHYAECTCVSAANGGVPPSAKGHV